MIRLIKIKNFRSIANETIKVEEITTFVGGNDAGKSNILRALNLFFNNETDHATAYSFSADYNQFARKYSQRAQEVVIELGLKLPKSYRRSGIPDTVYWKKVWREGGVHKDGEELLLCTIKNNAFIQKTKLPDGSKIRSLLNNITFHYVPAIKDRNFFVDLQGKIYDAMANSVESNIHSSASAFEKTIGKGFSELMTGIQSSFGAKSQISLPKNLRSIFEQLEFNSDNIPLSRRGDGIKIRHIPLMLEFIGRQSGAYKSLIRPQIWGFEEPENNVEFSSCANLIDSFLNAAIKKQTQIIITTHSPAIYLINERVKSVQNIKSIRYYVSKSAETKETSVQIVDESEIHENIGFLPLISPIIQRESDAWILKNKAQDELINELKNDLKTQKCARVFVEGKSDKLVIERAIRFLCPEMKDKVYVEADGNNSCLAAADRAYAFFLVQKHVSDSEKIGGVLLVDQDKAGREAKKLFEDKFVGYSGKKIVKSLMIPQCRTVTNLRSFGASIEADLESLYPLELWEIALQRGWLEEKEKLSNKLSEKGIQYYVDNDLTLDELKNQFTSLQSMMFDYKFTLEGKVSMGNYISKLPDNDLQLEVIFTEFQFVKDMVAKLFS